MSTQSMEALELANRVRLKGAAAVAEVACGTLTLADALEDARTGCLPISRLLCAQRGWGPTKSSALLAGLNIRPTRRVSELTDRQRSEIAARANPSLAAPPESWSVRGRIEFMANDPEGVAEGLRAALVALHQGVEPNIIWAPEYRLAIVVSP